MLVKHARELARQWVIEEAAQVPGFRGAFIHGSTNWLPDDAELPANSDVDIIVVLEDSGQQTLRGKRMYGGVMLEVSSMPEDEFQSADQVLGVSHLAGSFQAASILLDPCGHLAKLQAAVAQNYASRRWVYKRCEHARNKVLRNLHDLDASESAPFHDQVIRWLFGVGVTTHILLVAGLQNPTVRKRYVAARELLAAYGRSDFYDPLLDLLGCAEISPARVAHHLAALADVFDVTKTLIKTPFLFAADISDIARPIAIDGSREMIERGDHREAVFWIAVTYSRCHQVLSQDAPVSVQETFYPGYRQLLGDLGITSFADLQQRSQQVQMFLPRVWEVAETIMAANPKIKD